MIVCPAVLCRVGLSLATGLVACKRTAAQDDARVEAPSNSRVRAERIVLDGIEIKWEEADQPEVRRDIYPRLLAQSLGTALTETEWYYANDADVPDGVSKVHAKLELIIRYDVATRSDGRRVLLSAVAAELRWSEAGNRMDVSERALLERILEPGNANVAGELALNVERAVATVGVGLVEKERLRAASDEEVVRRLLDTQYQFRLWALEVVRHRRLRSAFDAVLSVLSDQNRELSGAAVGALVAIGDERAVPYLTKRAPGDTDMLPSVIEAVSVLGGSEAEDYLAYLSTGHPDAHIRSLAKAALERVVAHSTRRK